MRRYEKYISSGVEWIGEIPSHWSIKSLKRVTKEHRQGYYTSDDYVLEGVKLIRITDIQLDTSIDYEGMPFIPISEKDEKIFQVRTGDFLFPRTGSTDIFGLVENFERAVFASYLINFRFDNQVVSGFLKYYFSSHPFRIGIETDLHGGVNKNIHAENIKNQIIAFPSAPEEQNTIAQYLEEKTAKIDTLIEKKQKLIDLLKEERKAIINNAVSGEGKNWERKKLKHFFDCFDHMRVPLNSDERARVEKLYDYYGASGIIDKVDKYIFDGDYILLGEDGANLLARSSPLAFKATGKFWVNNHAHILRPKNGNIDFFTFLLESIDYSIWVSGSAQPKLTAENLMNVYLRAPDPKEQDTIVLQLTTELKVVDNTIQNLNSELELIKEYKTSLISEVITGKVKVV